MNDHTYTEKNKDTETKIEIPTPTPTASVRQTPRNSTEAQTETEKQALPISHLQKATAQTGPQPRTARFTSKLQIDCRYIIYELETLCEWRQNIYIYMTNNHMYIQRQVLAPAPVIHNIKSRLHTCNAHHQPSA